MDRIHICLPTHLCIYLAVYHLVPVDACMCLIFLPINHDQPIYLQYLDT